MHEEILEKLNSFINARIQETESSFAPWYKKSKWYTPATAKDAFGEYIAGDMDQFQKDLALNKDILHFVEYFENKAKEYGRSWYDEDLGILRSGCEDESRTYTFLRNLAAEVCGKEQVDLGSFYEGYSEE